MKKYIILTMLLVVLTACQKEPLTNFEECVAAGNPIMESYPEKCRDPISDKTFTREIDDAWKLDGITLMQHEAKGYYACFGCGTADIGEPAICVDPIAAMKPVEETQSLHCNDKLEVIKDEADGARTISDIRAIYTTEYVVYIALISDIRAIYTTEYVEDTSEYEQDCIQRGGYFKECGSACPTDNEECPAVCALTCEFEEPIEPKKEAPKTFQEKLYDIAKDRGIIPIEGHDAFSLMQAFPGLKSSDFHEVLTLEGEYIADSISVIYKRTSGNPVTSAEQMITQEGYKTLLQHLSGRYKTENENLIIEYIANEPDNKYCKDDKILSVFECNDFMIITESNPDSGSKYIRYDETEISCPKDDECEIIKNLVIRSDIRCIEVC